MNPERWSEVERLFHSASALALDERDAFLRAACAGDESLRRDVESLLAQPVSAYGYWATPSMSGVAVRLAADSGSALIGESIGAYRILSRLGVGGMGEVYRAHDATLQRDVAIKILPRLFATDPARLARFAREARLLAALNHPHIGAIYGIEESHGVRALVLELVEGETLADRLQEGPVPIAEALAIARQIADALEAAHAKGIIHRDLKPANVKVTAGGIVKVIDFGLAKATGRNGTPDFSQPPAMSIGGTHEGVIVGTASYMSPEQARGQAVDQQTDIWAFGCVLYEMLIGQRLFTGETVTDVLAAVITVEPDWSVLAETPAPIRRLLRRCLEKDPQRRLADVHDARLELDEASSQPDEDGVRTPRAVATATAPAWRRALRWGFAASLAAALAVLLVTKAPFREATPPHVTRMRIAPTGRSAVAIHTLDRDLALSPDGSNIVYVGDNGAQLFVRALDALEPTAIASGGPMHGPFVSPNGQWVGFFVGINSFRKVATTGGPPITVAGLDGPSRGATWTIDDTIIFATANPATGLQRVSAAGGVPAVLTWPDHAQGEADHLWPEILPGGRVVLFTITAQAGGLEKAQVAVRDLGTGKQKVLIRGGSHARYIPSGHLIFVAAGALRAIPFDVTRLETHGTAMPVLTELVTTSTGAGDFDVTADGTLVYLDAPGSVAPAPRTLVWVDRTGKEEPLAAPPRAYLHPSLSPDGTRVALSSDDQEHDLWIWDLRRAMLSRLTLDPAEDRYPVWTRDGRRIIFSSDRSGQTNLWWQATDGSGAAERLTTSSNAQFATGITPDGRAVVFTEQTPAMGRDLQLLTLDGTHRVTPLLQTKFDERNAAVSPDGRWLAYESNSSGVFEIYVRPFPNVDGGQWEVSTGGGRQPLWAPSGRELFYVGADGSLMRVPVEANGATWNGSVPIKLLQNRYLTGPAASSHLYDVSRDGRRFLMVTAPTTGGSPSPTIGVVFNWTEELKQRVPVR